MSTPEKSRVEGPRIPVVIVGAGPIGLELAVALKHHGVEYRQYDAGTIGQTITWYPRGVRFFSSPERIAIAGVPLLTSGQEKATREEYLSYLRGVVLQFDLAVHTYRRVTEIRREDGGFRLQVRSTSGGETDSSPVETVRAEAVVIAIGDMNRPRRMGIPGEDLPHVSHHFDEPHPFFRKRLLIVGGRNSAVEAALRCHRAGAQVHLCYRRAEFVETSVKYWLLPDLRNQIRGGQIEYSPETVPLEILPDQVRLRHEPTGEERTVPADFVLLLTGYEQDTTLFEQTGIRLEGGNAQPVIDEKSMQTEVPGLYVAGTAVAGTQVDFKLFIENSHPHVSRIIRSLTGKDAPFDTGDTSRLSRELPES